MKFAVMLLVVFFGIVSYCSKSHSTARTQSSTTYALRPCSTCKEVVYPTEAECRAAAFAEAERVGATRTTGSAVYTCIARFNVIATFYAGASTRQATLSWQYTPEAGTPVAEGFRVVYGNSPGELNWVVQVSNPGLRSYTLTNLAPGTYYFAVKSYAGGNESSLSNIISKVIL